MPHASSDVLSSSINCALYGYGWNATRHNPKANNKYSLGMGRVGETGTILFHFVSVRTLKVLVFMLKIHFILSFKFGLGLLGVFTIFLYLLQVRHLRHRTGCVTWRHSQRPRYAFFAAGLCALYRRIWLIYRALRQWATQ